MDQTPNPENAKRLDAEGRCIVCGKTEKRRRRGLCNKDYQKWTRAKAKVTDEEYAAWEASLVAKGLLLSDGREADDPFLQALAELRGKAGHVDVPDRGDEETEIVAEGERKLKKRAVKKSVSDANKRSGTKRKASGE